jgi:hypothetical protein
MGRRNAPEATALGELFANLVALATAAYVVWSTTVAFTGGNVPFTAWHLPGGPVSGAAWTLVAVPLLVWAALGVVGAGVVLLGLAMRVTGRLALRPTRRGLRVVR